MGDSKIVATMELTLTSVGEYDGPQSSPASTEESTTMYQVRMGTWKDKAQLGFTVGGDLERAQAFRVGRKYRVTVEEI